MSGADALASAYAKLDWASSRHDEMHRTFTEFARPGGGDDRPYGIQFELKEKPPGLVIARFIVEKEMPVEMGLLAGDVIYNTRVALDHTLARLKDRFGGDAGSGGFPVCRSEKAWNEQVVDRGRRSPLRGLEDSAAYGLIHAEQPMRLDDPEHDPLAILNHMDNADKHRLLHPAFVYPGDRRGVDLIEVLDPHRVVATTNAWQVGQELENGTRLATCLVRGPMGDPPLRTRRDATIGYATGDLEGGPATYMEMVERVRGIVDKAVAVIDATPR